MLQSGGRRYARAVLTAPPYLFPAREAPNLTRTCQMASKWPQASQGRGEDRDPQIVGYSKVFPLGSDRDPQNVGYAKVFPLGSPPLPPGGIAITQNGVRLERPKLRVRSTTPGGPQGERERSPPEPPFAQTEFGDRAAPPPGGHLKRLGRRVTQDVF